MSMVETAKPARCSSTGHSVEMVKRRLREAGETFELWEACTRKPGPSGIMSLWPDILRSAAESYGWDGATAKFVDSVRPTPPPPAAITRMWETIDWLNLVNSDDRRLLWAWAIGVPQWKLAQRNGRTERTIRLWIARACGIIAGQLAERASAKPVICATSMQA